MVCSLPLKGGFIFKLAQDLNRSDGKAHLVVKAMLLDGKVEEVHHIREEEEPTQVGGPNPLASMQEVQSKLGPTVASKTQRGSTVTSVSLPPHFPIAKMIANQETLLGHLPLCKRLGHCFQWWEKHSHPQVLHLIKEGISLPNLPPILSLNHHKHSQEEIHLAKDILEDYLQSGAVLRGEGGTKHLIPWFVLSKQEETSTKHRLISDCREFNQFVETKKIRLQNLHNIIPFLKKGDWSAKIDLKDAYFHLPLHQSLKPYLRMEVGGEYWEFQAGCFGLNVMPHLFMQVMKVLEKKWRSQGIICFIYLDDILLLGPTKKVGSKTSFDLDSRHFG